MLLRSSVHHTRISSLPLYKLALQGCLSEDKARFYVAEVVDALEYIHSMGLIHQDISQRKLLSADGHTKIADFGSVKQMEDTRITVLPNAASAAYVPPEVLNSSPATFGNDHWAHGCTLYDCIKCFRELLCLKMPVNGSSSKESLPEILDFHIIFLMKLEILLINCCSADEQDPS